MTLTLEMPLCTAISGEEMGSGVISVGGPAAVGGWRRMLFFLMCRKIPSSIVSSVVGINPNGQNPK